MPGLQQCAACSASLAAAESPESVMPPRARDRTLGQRLDQKTGASGFILLVRSDLSRMRLWLTQQTSCVRPVYTPSLWHVLLCIIPGVGHLLAYGNLRAGLAQFVVGLCALSVAVASPGTLVGGIAASVVLSLSAFSVFVFVDKHWGSKVKGRRAWVQRILLMLGILICFNIANYYLGYLLGIARFLRAVFR